MGRPDVRSKEDLMEGTTSGKAVVNLTTGHEDADKVTVAFLVGTAGLTAGKQVVMFLTKEAVRLATPGYADAIESAGAPPVSKLFAQFAEDGGELYACPICFDARKLDPATIVPNARIAGATPLWEFVGEGATVFSY
jgi:predicted peroxiredoxin